MAKIEFAPYLLMNEANIYSFRIDDDKFSEFEKFLIMFKDVEDPLLLDDFNRIVLAVRKMSENGILENYFRYEGKISDRVVAIPLEVRQNSRPRETLRLYCLRISDRLLIIGNGGIKKTKTYQENQTLYQYVKMLQRIDKGLMDLEKNQLVIEDEILNIILDV